jgi:hypothetical protein
MNIQPKISEGVLSVVSGSSRNGKTVYVQRKLQAFDRVIVWDVDGEYNMNGFKTVRSIGELVRLIKSKGREKLKVSYLPESLEKFDDFCRVAMAWALDVGGIGVVVEETADVTTPSKAPANFRILIGRGMKRGISLFCVTQRPSESDKTSLGNAKIMTTFYMSRANDREYMAREMGCESSEIEALEKLNYLEKNVDERKTIQGKIVF